MKKYLLVSVICAMGILSILNLFHPGFPVLHDGDVHLLRLTNFYQSLQEGNLIPRWAWNVNNGYGQPVFEFFYPLPYYLASVLHYYHVSYANSIKIILILSMVLSGCTMFMWLQDITDLSSATVGSMLYIFAPYRFVDTYVRGDIGECLSLVFIPLILWSIARIEKKPSFFWVVFGGVSFSLLILSHNVVSLLALPFIIFYGIVSFLYHSKKKLFGGYFFWLLGFGFLLSAFFWMPGLFEAKYTLRDIVTKGEYAQRFVNLSSLFYGPWQYGGEGRQQFTVQLGLLQWLALIISIIVVLMSKMRNNKKYIFLLGTVCYVLISIFCMLPYSNFIWSKILLLQNFQFPWRFLVATVLGCSILSALIFSMIPKKYQVIGVVTIILVVLLLNYPYMHTKKFVTRPDTFFNGVQQAPADTGESTPIWSVRFMEHGYMHPLEVIQGNARIKSIFRNSVIHRYRVLVSAPSRFIENTLYFPGWSVIANNYVIPVQFQDEQYRGLLTFNLLPGKYKLMVIFTDTKFRLIADSISAISFVVLSVLSIFFAIRFLRKKTA